ncbi:MAG: uracil-DNA glycosylase family protein [Rhizobiaceae bacterium]|nr:uracil-DNA glycosylase family protein [Rhizobiaceae bacterium]
MTKDIETLTARIKVCTACVDAPYKEPLPHDPRPVSILSDKAKVRIIGQAPGTRVHESGRPFTDPSGDRLREWMGISEEAFYDSDKLAITPMGFCFPGLDAKGGDLPPRKECADLWQAKVTEAMPQIELVLLIGMYAQKHYLGKRVSRTLTETVADWRSIMAISSKPVYLPLPHPSWRNNAWIKKNPWFSSELLPELKRLIQLHMLSA